uniref:U12-hexatoxin-Mg1a n=1 Tax=Macrothele gigas TaxID=223896 RepID=TXM11_MACGS|nr:RecName: Full=U12-hexatoxin-Mg1a; Short=U12-HXTX-Mg1a; AltName: Full=Neurotoxin magi-11; AltName: Full=Peptide toxin 5; Flags: Precursor [Macrothele gigas]BAD13406.1 peptide toxin 5 precursor [Macrothele gigas]
MKAPATIVILIMSLISVLWATADTEDGNLLFPIEDFIRKFDEYPVQPKERSCKLTFWRCKKDKECCGWNICTGLCIPPGKK